MAATGIPIDFHIYVDNGAVASVLDENDPQRMELMKAWAEIFNRNERYREADECLRHGIKSPQS